LTPDQLSKVLVIFMASLQDAFRLPIALTGVAFFLPFLLTRNMWLKGGIKLEGA
jgi:hypothetical protein